MKIIMRISHYKFWHYVCFLSFLSVAIVMLSSSISLRLPQCSDGTSEAGRHSAARIDEEVFGRSGSDWQLKGLQEKDEEEQQQHYNITSEEIDEQEERVDPAAESSHMDGSNAELSHAADSGSELISQERMDNVRADQLIKMKSSSNTSVDGEIKPKPSSCDGRRVFMYDLPAEFNTVILEKCENKITDWLNFCPHFLNEGFGKAINDSLNWPDWYETDPYMLEVMFHRRMPSYACITQEKREADAFFIPYYSGLDALNFLYGKNMSERAAQGLKLVRWLEEQAEETWRRLGGHDHFIVMGRTAWDFTRPLDNQNGSWGTSFASLPEMENVTSLFLERRPWPGLEQAIPYPTAFHPRSVETLRDWQDKIRAADRPFLFAFVGASRPGDLGSVRQAALKQCVNSTACMMLDCSEMKCAHNPLPIAEGLLGAEFCLQPPGDTATRRSTFDGMLSGCIPVFFRNDSAYTQYTWHLPMRDPSSYSVFIPPTHVHRLEEVLAGFSPERISRMRAAIIELIPGLIYASPPSHSIRDAFELSVEGMLHRVAEHRKVQQQAWTDHA